MKTLKRRIEQIPYGFHQDKELFILSLKNDNGVRLRITNFAATIMSLEIPNMRGIRTNVIVGFDSLQDYVEKSKNKESGFLGASVGRYAGRISNKGFNIDGIDYPLHYEDGVHLHGGKHGFDERVWDIEDVDEDALSVSLSYVSHHMEEGYPGNLKVRVTYQLTDANELKINYQAVSDQDTVINLTNHAYYNLNGKGSITDHILTLNSSNYLEVNQKQLPTGLIKPVKGTKYDFLRPRSLSSIREEGIIDDTLVFDAKDKVKAILRAPESGITMEVYTNQPAMVIYTPEKFPDWKYREEVNYNRFPSICFETQNYPDAPNHSNFPSPLLKAGEQYENRSTFRFSWPG